MKLVYQESGETASVIIDTKEVKIPSGKVTEVPEIRGTDYNPAGPLAYTIPPDYVVKELMAKLWWCGLIEVKVERDGFQMKLEDESSIKARAKAALDAAERQIVADWVQSQQQRIQQNAGALPPGGRALHVIEKRGIDIAKEYNLRPAGYGTLPPAITDIETKMRAEYEQRMADELAQQKATFDAKFNEIMKRLDRKAS